MDKQLRHIIGRTDCPDIATRAAAYLNERFPLIGAIAEPSGVRKEGNECKYLILCGKPISAHDSASIVESCRAYINAYRAAAEAAEETDAKTNATGHRC